MNIVYQFDQASILSQGPHLVVFLHLPSWTFDPIMENENTQLFLYFYMFLSRKYPHDRDMTDVVWYTLYKISVPIFRQYLRILSSDFVGFCRFSLFRILVPIKLNENTQFFFPSNKFFIVYCFCYFMWKQ